MISYKNKGAKIVYTVSFIHTLLIKLLVTDILYDTTMNKTDTICLMKFTLLYRGVSNTLL